MIFPGLNDELFESLKGEYSKACDPQRTALEAFGKDSFEHIKQCPACQSAILGMYDNLPVFLRLPGLRSIIQEKIKCQQK